MRTKDFLLVFTLSLILISLLFVSSALIVVYDLNFYKSEFVKSGVYEKFSDVDNLSNNLIDYFNGEGALLDVYSQREIIHLEDVKDIINSLTIFYYFFAFLFSFLCLFLFYKKYKYLNLVFIIGSVSVLFIILVLYLFSLFNFDFLFVAFHEVSFDNDFWLLSENTTLINLFPVGFFIDAFVRILSYSVLFAILFLLISFEVKKRLK